MAVLVNADSISAAEFFAAALQEYDKAIIVGGQTMGKGYSQQNYVLSDGSALHLSDQEYFTPQGKSLIGTGVTPDVPTDCAPKALTCILPPRRMTRSSRQRCRLWTTDFITDFDSKIVKVRETPLDIGLLTPYNKGNVS